MGTLACGRVETYPDDIARLREMAPVLASDIADFTGIAQVIDWMSQRGDGKPKVELIGMDEFEYDFIVEAEPNGPWLAFGVT